MERKANTALQTSLKRLKEETSKESNSSPFFKGPFDLDPGSEEKEMFLDCDAATSIYRDQMLMHTKPKQPIFPFLEHSMSTFGTPVATTAGSIPTPSVVAAETSKTIQQQQNKFSDPIHKKTMTGTIKFPKSRSAPMTNTYSEEFKFETSDNKTKSGNCMKINQSTSADVVLGKCTISKSFSKPWERKSPQYSRVLQEVELRNGRSKQDDSEFTPETLSTKAQKRLQRSRPWRLSESPRLMLSDKKRDNDEVDTVSMNKEKTHPDKETNRTKTQKTHVVSTYGIHGPAEMDTSCRVKVNKVEMRVDGSRLDDSFSLKTQKHIPSISFDNACPYHDFMETGVSPDHLDEHCKLLRLDPEQESCKPFVESFVEPDKKVVGTPGVSSTLTTIESKGAKEDIIKKNSAVYGLGGSGSDGGPVFFRGEELSDDSVLQFPVVSSSTKKDPQGNVKILQGYIERLDSTNKSLVNDQLDAITPSATQNTKSLHTSDSGITGGNSQGKSQTPRHRSKIPVAVPRKTKPGSPEKQQTSNVSLQELSRDTSSTPRSKSAPLERQPNEKKGRAVKFWNDGEESTVKSKTPAKKNMGSYHKLYCDAAALAKRRTNSTSKLSKKLSFSMETPSQTNDVGFTGNLIMNCDKSGYGVSSDDAYNVCKADANNVDQPNLTPRNTDTSECKTAQHDRDRVSKSRIIVADMSPFAGASFDSDLPEGTKPMPPKSKTLRNKDNATTRRTALSQISRRRHPPFTQNERVRCVDTDENLYRSSFGDIGDNFSPVLSKPHSSGKNQKSQADCVVPPHPEGNPRMIWPPSHQEGQILSYIEQLRSDRMRNGDERSWGKIQYRDFPLIGDLSQTRKPETLPRFDSTRQENGFRSEDHDVRNGTDKSGKGRSNKPYTFSMDRHGYDVDNRGREHCGLPGATICNVYTQTCNDVDCGAFPTTERYSYDCDNACFADVVFGNGGRYCGVSTPEVDQRNQVMNNNLMNYDNHPRGDQVPNDGDDKLHSEYSDDINADDFGCYVEENIDNNSDDGSEQNYDVYHHLCQNHSCTKLPCSQQNVSPQFDEYVLKEFDNVLTSLYSETRLAALKAEKVKMIIDQVVSKTLKSESSFKTDMDIDRNNTAFLDRQPGVGREGLRVSCDKNGRVGNDADKQWEGTFGDFLLLLGFMTVQVLMHLAINDRWGDA